MARSDIPVWTFVGVFVGMISASVVDTNLVLLGAIAGGIIGYMLGKSVR